DPAILQTCIIVFIGVVLPFLTGLLVSCTATIVDENGVCKALFHWRFNRMAWEEVAEIGVRYPYGVNHIMVQVYFSNLVTEDGKPIKPIGRKVKQRLVLLPYTKKFENYVLELAEMNPSIGKKFRDFPVVKDTAK
ncbi:MAG: hypothetical protein FWE97_03095, partial [Dehalococcoidia bacterium]|nr:hypothetical protein [Dehalococcoidia bacterium]